MVSLSSIVKFEVTSKDANTGRFVSKSKGNKFSIAAKDPVTGRYMSMQEAGQRVKDFIGKSLKERPAINAETINRSLGINQSDKSLATLLAQAERRTTQATDKAARSASKNGMVTVFDATKGVHVSATPAEAKSIKAVNEALENAARSVQRVERRAAQAAEKAAKDASKNGMVTVFDATKGLHVSATPAEAKTIKTVNEALKQGVKETTSQGAQEIVQQVAKKPSIWKKVAKWGLIGAGIALLGLGGYYLFKKYKDSKNTPVTPTPAPSPKPNPKPAPAPVKPPVKGDENQENPVKPTTPTEYTVKKGDNLWNIAKQYLKDLHKDDPNYKPTNKEILEKTEELMRLNNKEYEKPLPSDSTKRIVIIKENEKIKLTA